MRATKFSREAQLTSALLKALKKIPRTKWWRVNTGFRGGVRFGEKGHPDIAGLLHGGRAIFVETKMPGEKLRPDQETWTAEAIQLGAIVIVTEDMDDALRRVMAIL